MSAHSPGPWRWKVQQDARNILVDKDGDPVLRGQEHMGVLIANERLVAAAPELLAALKKNHDRGDVGHAFVLQPCATCALITRLEGGK